MKKEILKAYINTRKALRRWVLRMLQPCRKMVPLISESMERRLDISEWVQLRLHLMVCAWCARYLKQIKFIRQLLREEPSNERSTTTLLDAEARQRINKSLLNQ